MNKPEELNEILEEASSMETYEKVVKKIQQEYEEQKEFESSIPVEEKKEINEKYGVGKRKRTKKQWKNLVDDFGLEKVAAFEGITESKIKRITEGSFSDRVRKSMKKKK